MNELFRNVLEASFHGGVVIAVVLLARQVLKKVPKKYICLLWLLAALRLLMPFEIQSGFSLQPDLTPTVQAQGVLDAAFYGGIMVALGVLLYLALSKVPQKYISLICLLTFLMLVPLQIWRNADPQTDLTPSVQNGSAYVPQGTQGQSAEIVFPETVSPAIPDAQEHPQDVVSGTDADGAEEEIFEVADYVPILAWVWLTVAVGMLGYSVVSYLRLRRRVGDAVILAEGIWVSGRVESPFVMGFFRPRIYLNPGLSERNREYVLAHEKCHIRRLDHWWKWLGFLTLAIHWFNPLVWLGYILLCRDLEMACDEAVVREMEVGERKAYSAALLSCSARGNTIAACPVAFGEVSVKGRIQNVLNYRRPKFWLILAAVVAVVVIAVCFLTSPVQHNLLELSGVSAREISGLRLRDLVGSAGIFGEKELAEVVKVLKAVRYDPDWKRVDYRPEESDSWYDLYIYCDEEQVTLHFTEDFTYAWQDAENIRAIQNPEALQALFEEKLNAVTGRHATGEPFATVDDAAAWASGIHLNTVESVEYYRTTRHEDGGGESSLSGNLREASFRELLEALNALPQDAFTEKNTLLGRSMDELDASDLRSGRALTQELTSVTIQDGANGLVAVLRYYVDNSGEEFLELAITDDREGFEGYAKYLKNLRFWSVESKALCAVMGDFAENAPVVQYSGGVQKAHWGIVATGKNASATGIQFCFVQTDPYIQGDLFYDQAYTLLRHDEDKGEWVAVEPIIEDGAYDTKELILPKDTTIVVDIGWEWLYGPLTDGVYCIRKDVRLDSETYTFDVYFGVEDGYEAGDSDTTEALDVAGKTFTYEKDGFGGAFNIALYQDHTFTYYEGLLSSYIGMGNWALDGDTLILFDEGMGDKIRYYYFRVTEDALIFQAEKSHDFMYVDVADGDRFYLSGDVAQQELTNETVLNMCAGAYTELCDARRFYILVSTPSNPYPFGEYQYVDGENYYINALPERGYNTLKYNGTVYFYVQQDYMEDKSIPTGWMTDSWVREHYGTTLDGTRETFPWETGDWDSLGLELERWERQDGGLVAEFSEKADPAHLWSFKLDGKGDLESITSSPDRKMEVQWTIRGINGTYLDEIPLWYANACRSVPDAVIVRDQAFYEELFTRQTDGHFTTDWIGHLYEAFYAEPEEFTRQMARKFSEGPEQIREVLTCMRYEVEWYEPERLSQTLADLRNVADLDPAILDLMAEYLLAE